MPIEIKITGNHATDVVAEVRNLALIMGVADITVPSAPSQAVERAEQPLNEKIEKVTSTPATGGTTDKPLTRKEQDEAVKYMINQGEKDDRFEKLTKGRQDEIETALAKLNAVEDKKADADLDDMFADDTAEAEKVVTREDVSAMMAKVGKDEDGNGIQDRLLKIRAVLVENIPEGLEPKVKNIPEDKLATVHALIEKIGD